MGPAAGPRTLGEMSVFIYSQNLRGMSPEKEEELASRLNLKRLWAACLQETWRLGSTSWKNRGLTFLHGGLAARQPKRRATQCVAIVLGPETTRAWELAGSRVLRFGKSDHCNAPQATRLGAEPAHDFPRERACFGQQPKAGGVSRV